VAVETGILERLGSRTILRALQRNAEARRDGHLWSFDIMRGAGALVPERLATRWTPPSEASEQGLPRLLAQRSVGFFIHDSLPDPERDLSYAEFCERPQDHFYGGRHLAWARVLAEPD
jgi:hypothetical protein